MCTCIRSCAFVMAAWVPYRYFVPYFAPYFGKKYIELSWEVRMWGECKYGCSKSDSPQALGRKI